MKWIDDDKGNNIFGTPFADYLVGNGGDDWIRGEGGDDILYAGSDNDIVEGGSGNDFIKGNSGSNSLYGGSDDDIIVSGSGSDWIDGGTGIDLVSYEEAVGDVSVSLTSGTATEYASNSFVIVATDQIRNVENVMGGRYDDYLSGNDARNEMWGGDGDDTMFGRGGDDYINAGSGDDSVEGGTGNDRLRGSYGNDTLRGGAGDDRLEGESGYDTAVYSEASGGVQVDLARGVATGAAGNDSLSRIENVTGSWYAYSLEVDGYANTLRGLGGNDYLEAGNGNDRLEGGSGHDALHGQSGNDVIFGGSGNDYIAGGTGNDVMSGGSGSDYFVFATTYGATGDDKITDFNVGDRIDLRQHAAADGWGFGNVLINTRQDGSDTVIDVGADSIRLEDFDSAYLEFGMFVL